LVGVDNVRHDRRRDAVVIKKSAEASILQFPLFRKMHAEAVWKKPPRGVVEADLGVSAPGIVARATAGAVILN